MKNSAKAWKYFAAILVLSFVYELAPANTNSCTEIFGDSETNEITTMSAFRELGHDPSIGIQNHLKSIRTDGKHENNTVQFDHFLTELDTLAQALQSREAEWSAIEYRKFRRFKLLLEDFSTLAMNYIVDSPYRDLSSDLSGFLYRIEVYPIKKGTDFKHFGWFYRSQLQPGLTRMVQTDRRSLEQYVMKVEAEEAHRALLEYNQHRSARAYVENLSSSERMEHVEEVFSRFASSGLGRMINNFGFNPDTASKYVIRIANHYYHKNSEMIPLELRDTYSLSPGDYKKIFTEFRPSNERALKGTYGRFYYNDPNGFNSTARLYAEGQIIDAKVRKTDGALLFRVLTPEGKLVDGSFANFGDLFVEPLRYGIFNPFQSYVGKQVKVRMVERFANPRIGSNLSAHGNRTNWKRSVAIVGNVVFQNETSLTVETQNGIAEIPIVFGIDRWVQVEEI